MKLRAVLAFAVVFALAGTVGFGDSQRRTVKGSFGPFAETGFVVGQCDGFEVWSDWVALITWVDVLDKDGQWVRSTQHYKVLGESLYYNSEDPDRVVAGGPGENENANFDAASGVLSSTACRGKSGFPATASSGAKRATSSLSATRIPSRTARL